MVIEYGSLARLGGPASRSSGTKKLGATSKYVMVHSEALLVGLFPDENIESLGEIVVEPMNSQSQRARNTWSDLNLQTFFALQVVGRSHQTLLTGGPPSWCRVACCVGSTVVWCGKRSKCGI